ncbi:preprotein translocase subunit YajC [Paradesulfitobacterium ferrireducens]|uniref:preprotein translocase subunit YajC n=1 Tax=Paradesulfitobacterium ferrireducens TaxID=2816476 RepID=UPI001A8EAAE2|nr:preprotein translocase subunit YajC [Paradesulfitobacterium ferrireducens]
MPSSTVTLVLYFAVFFGIVYFLMIRPQQKQQKQRQALLSSLKVKDKVITVGGIHGKIMKVKDKSVILQIADKVEIEIAKAGIASVENREITADDKKNKEDKNNSDESGEKAEQEKAEA